MNGLQEKVELAPLTTVGLGGAARYFVSCQSVAELKEALVYAREENLDVHVLGGGSNTVFADEGFAGLVIQVAWQGVSYGDGGKYVLVTAQAGEEWDLLVKRCVEQSLAGIECLSGIPGLVGAAPVQNVGAYGQQVSQVITSVQALDRRSLRQVSFTNDECNFSYRQSRFKEKDRNRYVVTAVTYKLVPGGQPTLRYPELAEAVGRSSALADVREAVLRLRRRKSMVINPGDPHARSCGSFFVNPVLSRQEFALLRKRYQRQKGESEIPSFLSGDGVKVPAAWLVEQAGFTKGTLRGGVGISPNHALALVNYEGTTTELLSLASEVQSAVQKRFGIELIPEPVVVA